MRTFSDLTIRKVATMIVTTLLVIMAASTAKAENWVMNKSQSNEWRQVWTDMDTFDASKWPQVTYIAALVEKVEGSEIEIQFETIINCEHLAIVMHPVDMWVDDEYVPVTGDVLTVLNSHIQQSTAQRDMKPLVRVECAAFAALF